MGNAPRSSFRTHGPGGAMPSQSSEDILASVRALAVQTFGCSPDAIRLDTSAVEVDGCDLTSHTQYLAAIERHFHVELAIARVLQFENVGDLVDELKTVLS